MSGRTASNTVTKYAGIQVQTSSLGLQIPVGWGTFRCRCNLVDYLDFKSVAQKAATGKGGGSTVTGYSYSATIILAICEGPIDSVSTVYVDSNVYVNGTNGQTALAQAGLSLSTGAIGQAVWSYLTSAHPDHAIGYSGLVIAYAENYVLDSGASTPNHSFEAVKTSSFGVGSTPDADPSLVMTDFFTNTRTGVPSWASGLLDTVSLTSAASSYQAYCLSANLLVSPVIDSERSASDFLTELLLATNSTCVWSEGKLKFIPYGDTAISGNGKSYTPAITPVYLLNDDNYVVDQSGDPPLQVDIQDQSDAYNVVQLEYLDRTNQYNMAIALASDAANVAQYGMRRQDPTTVHCICTPTVAAASAQLYLQRTLYIRAQYKFKLGWMFAILEPGDVVELTDSGLGLSAYPVRIIQIDEDEKYGLTITAEDLLVGVGAAPLYTMQNGAGYQVNAGLDPGGVEANLLFYSGDQTQAIYTKLGCTITGNTTTDQYGLTTADTLVPTTSAGIGAPVELGTKAAVGVTTIALTTLANSPAGNLLVVAAGMGASGTISSVTDSAGNTYTAGTSLSAPGGDVVRPFYCVNAAQLPAGGVITVTYSTSSGSKLVTASSTSGIVATSALDKQAAGSTGTGTTPSIATGTLGQASEIVFGFTFVATGGGDAFTEASGFTTEAAVINPGGSVVHTAYKIVAATTTITYAPVLGTSRAYAANVLSFKGNTATLTTHSVVQGFAAFSNQNYTFRVCIQKNAHKNARVVLGDGGFTNSAYIEVDTNAGVILTAGTATGTAKVVSATMVNSTLVSGIYIVTITVNSIAATTLYAGVYALSDAGALSWTGDNSNALNLSQWQVVQGLAVGAYANTTTAVAGPLIFNPPSVLSVTPETWAAVAGGPNWGGADVWVSFDAISYENIGTIDSPCTYGSLTTDITPNLLFYSQDFTQSVWTKVACTIGTGIPDPNSGTSACSMILSTTNADDWVVQTVGGSYQGQTVTGSVYLKSGTLTGTIQLVIFDGSVGSPIYAINAVTISSTWTRYSVTASIPAGAANGLQFMINPSNNTGTAGQTVLMWQADLVVGALASPFFTNSALYANPDFTYGFGVDLSASNGALSSATQVAANNGATMCLVDQELVCYETATLTEPSQFTLGTYILRGYLNSSPVPHYVGAPIVRIDSTPFNFPFYGPNVGSTVYVKFQSFNQWGGGVQSLADCNVYTFSPLKVGATSPSSAAWTATAIAIANAGQSIPGIQITGASDNPNATGIVFEYRVTGSMAWTTWTNGHANSTGTIISGLANGQTYDVSVLYLVNGTPSNREIVTPSGGLTVGTASGGGTIVAGATLIDQSVEGSYTVTLPAGTYGHVDVSLWGPGGDGNSYIVGNGSTFSVVFVGGGGGEERVITGIAVTPGTTSITFHISNTVGTASTVSATGPFSAMTANSGASGNASTGTQGAGGTGGTGGTGTNGRAGGLTDTWDGGGSGNGGGDQTTNGSGGTFPGGGGSGAKDNPSTGAYVAGAHAAGRILVIART